MLAVWRKGSVKGQLQHRLTGFQATLPAHQIEQANGFQQTNSRVVGATSKRSNAVTTSTQR